MREVMADDTKVDETGAQDNEQERGDFLGVDPIYMNYSDERNKPFRADAGEADDDILAVEEVSYAHQEWTREDAGQDPETGEPIVKDPKEAFEEKREQYKDPNWGPNVPHAMTAPKDSDAVSSETESRKAETQDDALQASNSSTSTSDDKAAPKAPKAPSAAAKKQ